MSNGGYIGVNDVAKRLSKIYLGDENNIARKIAKGYIGDANNIARLFYTAHVHGYLSNNDYTFDDSISITQHYHTESCDCGDTITIWEDHNYASYSIPATCTDDGYSTTICNSCEKVKKYITIPATGHTEIVDEAVLPDCTNDGLTEGSHCSVCGEVIVRQEYVAPLGHTAGNAVKENEVNATCGDDGGYDTVIYCSVCREELSRENTIIPATGLHNFTTVNGVESAYCVVCGAPNPNFGN